jgi:O-antigen/teichoic acid export membrane protein
VDRSQGINAILRGAGLVSRLVLILLLARFLPPAEVGLYGLFTVTVTYAMLAVGLDFYTFSQREVIARPAVERLNVVAHHAGACAGAYLLLLPILAAVFAAGYLPLWLAPWFALLLVLEHVGQELYRLLVALGYQVTAGVLLFVRQGLWVWVVVLGVWLLPEWRDLEFVLASWSIGSVIAVAGGLWCAWPAVADSGRISWDATLIKRGLVTGMLFLLATLCLRGLLTFDRYLLECFAGLEIVGAYTFYGGIAMAVMAFLESAVFVFRYPRMVHAWRHSKHQAYSGEWRRLRQQTVIGLAGLVAGALVVAPLAADLTGRMIYGEHLEILWIMLAAVAFQALGMIPHYGLYAMHRDRWILLAHAVGLAMFLAAAGALSPSWPVLGVPVGVTIGFAGVFFVKMLAYRYHYQRAKSLLVPMDVMSP